MRKKRGKEDRLLGKLCQVFLHLGQLSSGLLLLLSPLYFRPPKLLPYGPQLRCQILPIRLRDREVSLGSLKVFLSGGEPLLRRSKISLEGGVTECQGIVSRPQGVELVEEGLRLVALEKGSVS